MNSTHKAWLIRAIAPIAIVQIIAAVTLARSSPAQVSVIGANAEVQPTLTLVEVYAAAEQRSPHVAAATEFARASASRVPAATKPPDPTLQLGLMNYMLPSMRPDASLGMRQLQLMQMVPLPGKLAAAGSAARQRAEAAVHRVAATRWEVRYDAAKWFYERWVAQQQLVTIRDTRRLLEDASAIAAAMYRVGDGRQADVLRAHVEIARMDEEIVRMEFMSNAALARLAATLDIAAELIDAVLVLPEFLEVMPSLDSLVLIALAGRPLLAAAESETRAAGSESALAARDRWPDLELGVQYGERGTPMGTDRMMSFMLGASIPIWAGSRQLRMQDEANAMEKMSRADLAAARADTRGRIGEAHTALSSSRRLASLYQTSVLPQSEAAAASALAAYRVGGVDFMTLVENRLIVNRYKMELVQLAAAEGRAWAELEMLTGVQLLLTSATADNRGGAPK